MYAEVGDVTARYEGTIPEDRIQWVELRIADAENELVGLVPSLANPTTVDNARKGRVRRLVCDKVLALFRNPDGAVAVADTFGPMTESRALRSSNNASSSWVVFTADELRSVRSARSKFGSISVAPWNVPGRTA